MTLAPNMIQPVAATIHGHLFENASVAVRRGLYWGIEIDFEEITQHGQAWTSNVLIDWLEFDLRRWPPAGSLQAAEENYPGAEPSFYLGSHWDCRDWHISIDPIDDKPVCRLRYSLICDFPGLDDDPVPNLRIEGSIDLSFTGIILVRDNLPEKPASAEAAAALVAPYFELDDRYVCADEGWRYVFKPR